MNEHSPIAPPRATYQDVIDAPEHMVAELINGRLHTHPRPAPPHIRAASKLGMKVGGAFDGDDADGPGGWYIEDEPELHLGPHVVVPDIAGWRRERMRDYPSGAFYTIVPDWACEVLSPSTRRVDLTEKRDIYAEYGVAHLWLVDPVARLLEAFALDGGRWILIGSLKDDAQVALDPFAAAPFALSTLWPD